MSDRVKLDRQKTNRQKIDRVGLFLLLNIALVVAALVSIVFISSLAEKYIDKDVFYITPVLNDNRFYFSDEDIELLKSACQPLKLAAISTDSAMISYRNFSAYTKIIHTTSDCFYLNNIKFSSGGPWSAARERENNIVINEALAWQLFGSLNVVDKAVVVGEEIYTVCGIACQNRVAKGDYTAYLPVAVQQKEQAVSGILIKVAGYNKLGPYLQINAWLEDIFKNHGEYYIADLNRYVENIALKYRLLLFLIGLYIIAVILLNSYRLIKLQRTRNKNSARFSIMLVIIAVLDAAFVTALLNAVSINIWLPQGAGSRLGELISTVTNSGSLPPREYLLPNLAQLFKLNSYANTALTVGNVSLFNFIFVHKGTVSSNKL